MRLLIVHDHLLEIVLGSEGGGERGADQAAGGDTVSYRMQRCWKAWTYLVQRTINAIFSVVRSSAAMRRSPSFSRSAESRTTIKLPAVKAVMESSIVSKSEAILSIMCLWHRGCADEMSGLCLELWSRMCP